MSSKKVPSNKNIAQTPQNKEKNSPKPSTQKRDILDFLDNFFQKKLNFFFWFGIILTGLFTFLLFEVKVGPGGDDSAYLQRAFDFIHEFKFPSYQGPLYPIIISPFIALFGINLPLLKFLSAIFLIIATIYFYKAFRNRIPSVLLILTFIIASYNYYLLYFGSQTYNEAFFMMLQAIFFYYALKYFTSDDYVPTRKNYIIIGLILFLMTLTKNIAYASVIALMGYFLFTKKWKNILYTFISFIVYLIPWEILKRILWRNNEIQFSSQGNSLMYKDFYNPSLGKEDFWGLLQRIVDNSNLYISKHFYKFMGLRAESVTDILPLLTVLTVAIFLVSLYFGFRKNKAILFTSIYVGCMLLISFISLQKHWDQYRLIIIYYPFMLLMFFAAFYYLFKTPQFKSLQFTLPVFAIIVFIASFNFTTSYAKVQSDVLSENLEGNMLYGLTPDWQSYILMSQWVGKNTPPEFMTACRKPEISFIYGERKFYGIYKVPSSELDSIIKPNKSDSLVYTLFHLKKLTLNEQRPDLKYAQYLKGVISGEFAFGDTTTDESNFVGIYGLPLSKLTEMRNDPSIKGIAFEEPNPKEWVSKMLQKNADISITDPDYLYDLLKKSKVKYAILASLRMNPNFNNGNIITTVHRYMYFIQLKYPMAFREVYKIGTDEPSSLIEIKLD
jgi:hypothetical protein